MFPFFFSWYLRGLHPGAHNQRHRAAQILPAGAGRLLHIHGSHCPPLHQVRHSWPQQGGVIYSFFLFAQHTVQQAGSQVRLLHLGKKTPICIAFCQLCPLRCHCKNSIFKFHTRLPLTKFFKLSKSFPTFHHVENIKPLDTGTGNCCFNRIFLLGNMG